MSAETYRIKRPTELFGSYAGGALEAAGISHMARVDKGAQEILDAAERDGFKVIDLEMGEDGPKARFIGLKKWYPEKSSGKIYALLVETGFDQEENVWIWDKDLADIRKTLNL